MSIWGAVFGGIFPHFGAWDPSSIAAARPKAKDAMTIEEATRRVAEIRASTHDPDKAHSLEDRLRSDMLAFIANEAPSLSVAAAAARIALSTDAIEFERWMG